MNIYTSRLYFRYVHRCRRPLGRGRPVNAAVGISTLTIECMLLNNGTSILNQGSNIIGQR